MHCQPSRQPGGIRLSGKDGPIDLASILGAIDRQVIASTSAYMSKRMADGRAFDLFLSRHGSERLTRYSHIAEPCQTSAVSSSRTNGTACAMGRFNTEFREWIAHSRNLQLQPA
jgi:hypothetical protein